MTGTDILNTIHTIYESNVEFPGQTEDEYLTRLAYLNQAIQSWQNEVYNGFLWSELYVSSIQPYTSTTIADFLYPEKLYINGKEYKYVQPYEATEIIANNLPETIYYITGGANNRIINLYPVLTAGQYVISYYKQATLYTSGNIGNHIEMSAPNYAIRYVLAQLYANDGDFNMSGQSANEAEKYLMQMKNGLQSMPMGSNNAVINLSDGLGI
jgi:hypothetical protein